MEYRVLKEYDGLLLKTYLKNVLFLSRSLVSMLKREQGIKVNGQSVTVRYVLKTGDVVEVGYEDKASSEGITPVDIPINVIYEDEHLVIVDKPPFMPVHPSHGHRMDTLANALCYRYQNDNFVMRAVNRLDRNTSGLVLVAKNRRAASILSNQMKKREIGKKYIALTDGIPPAEFSIEAPIRRRNESVIERCVDFGENGGEYAYTYGRTIKSFSFESGEKYSLVELVPHTGRTHQLRVHLSFMGHPIVGDELYGKEGERHMLHCCFLEFSHPESGERLSFYSETDFQGLI